MGNFGENLRKIRIEPEDAAPCDFALVVQDDSMQPRFFPGDAVFIRSQADVPDGRIAAIRTGGDMLLRRVYHLPDGLQLIAENPACPPMIVQDSSAVILGAAVRFSRELA